MLFANSNVKRMSNWQCVLEMQQFCYDAEWHVTCCAFSAVAAMKFTTENS